MSTGFTGPIDPGGTGDLFTHYAIATTYRVNTGWFNKLHVNCKRCGVELAKGEGTSVVVASINGPNPSSPYFCPLCVDLVSKSLRVVLDRQAKDARKEREQR